ncbi:MAG: hypothetical protein QME92_12775 [Bacillota bacterium]|nr:hypothetical protein [Bacillota bacterium]
MEEVRVYRGRTKFTRDRLRETRWEDRGYIAHLVSIEDVILDPKKRNGWASAIMYATLRNQYPIEWECIELELKNGIYVNPDEFRRRVAARRGRRLQEEEADRRREEEQEKRQREVWLKLGGKL